MRNEGELITQQDSCLAALSPAYLNHLDAKATPKNNYISIWDFSSTWMIPKGSQIENHCSRTLLPKVQPAKKHWDEISTD